MRLKRFPFFMMAAGCALVVTAGMFFLLPTQSVSAQCGSQASSCKNCHETQGQDPVNNDGTGWHSEHAFGDFCYLCHAGNNQAMDETAAHTGLVDPLSDVVASCKSCHADDYEAKAQIYADTLGVTIGTSPASASTTTPVPVVSSSSPATAVPVASVPAGSLVDYSQRYDEMALGKKPVNVGNVILLIMAAGLFFGGGFFVLRREHWLKISFEETRQIEGSYPVDVVEMVPDIARLKPSARKDLHTLLKKPATAGELFALVKKISAGEGSSADADGKDGSQDKSSDKEEA
jgi:cytochrome c553